MSVLGTSGIILLALVLMGLYMINRQIKARAAYAFGAEKACDDILAPADLDEAGAHIAYTEAQISAPASTGYAGSGSSAPVEPAPFRQNLRLRWGRLAIFGVGALALLASLVTGILAAVTALTFVTPVLLLMLGVGCLVALRVLALRDRDRRRASTALKVELSKKLHQPEHLTSPSPGDKAPSPEVTKAVEQPQRVVPELPARAKATLPISHAAKALRRARTQHQPLPAPAPAEPLAESATDAPTRLRMDEALPDTRWAVTEVPRPTYLDAPVAQRALVEPLEAPQAPQSNSKTLAEAAGMNLDDVLRRRRA